jgi:hypothetical protein
MEVVIRKAEKIDLKDILSLYNQPDMDNGVVLDITAAEHIFEKMKKYPDYCVYVAEINKDIGMFISSNPLK